MATGRVKWWNDAKGFGFIIPDDGSENIFAHFSEVMMEGYKTLHEGQRVEYSTKQLARGPMAAGIRSLDATAPAELTAESSAPVQPHRRRLNVFLCHSSGDKVAVRQLYDRLRSISYVSPWLDEKSLLPGQDWDLEIAKAVRVADCVVVCLSQSSINKEGYVQKEIGFALDAAQEKPEGTIFLIPVRLEECQPPMRLERWHYVNLYEERGFERLLLSLQFRATGLGVLLSP